MKKMLALSLLAVVLVSRASADYTQPPAGAYTFTISGVPPYDLPAVVNTDGTMNFVGTTLTYSEEDGLYHYPPPSVSTVGLDCWTNPSSGWGTWEDWSYWPPVTKTFTYGPTQ